MSSTHRDDKKLIEAATKARGNSVAPFSNFAVGAAVETSDGQVFTGCNIENATYGLTVCAERVAVWKALSEGGRSFARLAVVANTKQLTPPCGACRQILWEFCGGDLTIILANLSGETETLTLGELYPRGFDKKFLAEQPSE